MLPLRYGRKNRTRRCSTPEIAKLEVSDCNLKKKYVQIRKANPLTQPVKFCQPPKMNCASFRWSVGVVAGSAANVAIIIAKLAITKTFCNLARIRVDKL